MSWKKIKTSIKRLNAYTKEDKTLYFLLYIPIKILVLTPIDAIFVISFLAIKLLCPFSYVRIVFVLAEAIGHLAIEPELCLCEMDLQASNQKQGLLIVFLQSIIENTKKDRGDFSNRKLIEMWGMAQSVVVAPPCMTNLAWRLRGYLYSDRARNSLLIKTFIPEDPSFYQYFRDTKNLLDRSQPHLTFTHSEEVSGQNGLRDLGIPLNEKFVCLIVRDNAYYAEKFPTYDWSVYDFRNCNINNYVMAAEYLADNGYYVVRMGAKVQRSIGTQHPKIIDYATSGKRTEFMDIYLGAKCSFCISSGTGFDEIPNIFRKPMVYTNYVPIGRLYTFSSRYISIIKGHWCLHKNRRLSLREILSYGLDLCSPTTSHLYEKAGVKLIENSPREILSVTIEMLQRLEGRWQTTQEDEILQKKFWEIFPKDSRDPDSGELLHGEIRGLFGADYLRQDPGWLD